MSVQYQVVSVRPSKHTHISFQMDAGGLYSVLEVFGTAPTCFPLKVQRSPWALTLPTLLTSGWLLQRRALAWPQISP